MLTPVRNYLDWLNPTPFPHVSLELAGLIALIDFDAIRKRTALTGTASLLDLLVLCPGIYLQQNAPLLNDGEYPACGAMTTGYVFRVENPATVHFFQKVGRTGHLTTIRVRPHTRAERRWLGATATLASALLYLACVLLTLLAFTLLITLGDAWGVIVLLTLMGARMINTIVIRRRVGTGWSGAAEPGVHGDLLVLLSQDRWVRLRGLVDDLKAVTSGRWLRDASLLEDGSTALAKLLVAASAILAVNAYQLGRLILVGLLIGSACLLSLANNRTKTLQMKDRVLYLEGPAKLYQRRRDLMEGLVRESGREDWAIALGMKAPQAANRTTKEPVTATM